MYKTLYNFKSKFLNKWKTDEEFRDEISEYTLFATLIATLIILHMCGLHPALPTLDL